MGVCCNRTCPICGEITSGNVEACPEHETFLTSMRRTRGNLADAVRIRLAQIDGDPNSPTQRAALLYSELSDAAKIGVAYYVHQIVEAVRTKSNHKYGRPAYFGALSGLELLVTIMQVQA